jgi:hypothetical protein
LWESSSQKANRASPTLASASPYIEDADMAEVSITQPLMKQYKSNLNGYCLALKDYITRRGGTYLFTSTAVPFDTLVLNYLRERGLLG